MLKDARVATRLPVQELGRARAFYAEKLGLEPVEERDGGLRYVLAGGEFALFQSAGAPSGDHTQMGFEVDDIEATVSELRAVVWMGRLAGYSYRHIAIVMFGQPWAVLSS